MLPNAQGFSEPVIGAATFGAVVIMVIVTTLVTPPALKWALARRESPPTIIGVPAVATRETKD